MTHEYSKNFELIEVEKSTKTMCLTPMKISRLCFLNFFQKYIILVHRNHDFLETNFLIKIP